MFARELAICLFAIGVATLIPTCYAEPQSDQSGSAESNPQRGDTPAHEQPDQTHNPKHMGSTYVPLDSWIYPALDRLAALGYAKRGFEGMRPWTRMDCARMIDEAKEAQKVLYPRS